MERFSSAHTICELNRSMHRKIGNESAEISALYGKNFRGIEGREKMSVLSLMHSDAERVYMFRFFPDWHEYCTDRAWGGYSDMFRACVA